MKVSKKQKKATRQKIIRAAVELMAEHGLKSTTMQKIARQASIGDATIYNYFPTKEAILLAYYSDRLEDCMVRIEAIEDFPEYSLAEKLQGFFETSLELYLPDREFVGKTFSAVFFTFSLDRKPLQALRERFTEMLHTIFQGAVEAEEIPAPVFKNLIYQLFWEYYLGVVFYWLEDRSDQFNQTSLLIDQSLDLACAVLKAGLVNKVFDLAAFLFRHHILNRLDFLTQPFEAVHVFKRRIMADDNE